MQHERQKFKKGVDEEVNWSHQGNTFYDESPPGLMMTSSANKDKTSHLCLTMNRAREELKDLKQLPGQPISSYMYKYRCIHFLATGNQTQNDRYPTAIMEFIRITEPQINEGTGKEACRS